MGELFLSAITGLISGIISSLLFFWMMSMLRPSITISKQLCKYADDKGIFYGFKLLNHSSYNALDLKVELILNTPVNSHGGSNHSCEWIKLRKDGLLTFSRYKKQDNTADYALVLGTRQNLELIWSKDSQYIEVKVHAKHSFSGIYKSFNQKYFTKNTCIKDGMFNFGLTFDIS